MKKLFLLFIFFLSCSSFSFAQFASSETVYCYKYDYTINDGIKSTNGGNTYYFVNFQNDMMGVTWANNLNSIRENLVRDPDYYENLARNDLANNYEKWKRSPNGLPTRGPAQARANIIKYNPQYSKGSKYTYQTQIKYAIDSGYIFDSIYNNHWSDPQWGNQCYSFSADKSEMIVWSTNDPDNRKYYKRIYISELKPNTNFLD